MLESLVMRLSAQLAEAQSTAPRSRAASPDRSAAAATAARPPSPPSPRPPPAPWLADAEALAPLLAAYDAKIERTEAELAAQRAAVEKFQEQVAAGESDATRLQAELSEAMARAGAVRRRTAGCAVRMYAQSPQLATELSSLLVRTTAFPI